MNQVEKILDKKLVKNDIHLIKSILSYLIQCKMCNVYDNYFAERYIISCPCYKRFGKCNHDFLCGNEVWECVRICPHCIIKEIEVKGKNKVLDVFEYEEMLLRRQEEIMMIGIRRMSHTRDWGRITFKR